jgi:hypothetical protein
MLFTATAEKYLFKRQRGQLSRIPSHNRPKFYLTDSITGYSGVIIELIEKGLLFAFLSFVIRLTSVLALPSALNLILFRAYFI